MQLSSIFNKDVPEVSTVIIMRGHVGGIQVLLTRRNRAPGAGEWDIIGGHLQVGEDKFDAVHRETKEETGIDSYDFEYLHEGPAIPGRCRRQHIFSLVLPDHTEIEAGSDSREAKWFNLNDMPKLAFGQLRLVKKLISTIIGEGFDQIGTVLSEAKKKGFLVVFEGVDGAGKSTQVSALEKALINAGKKPIMTAWNSSEKVHPAIKKLKDAKEMYPILFSLMHAADLWHRYLTIIQPALDEGKTVVCDRYYYTSYARDQVRGIEHSFIKSMYKNMPEPDIVFHCSIDPEVAVERVSSRKDASYYGDGMDLKLAKSPKENHKIYTKLLSKEYDRELPKATGYIKVDMDRDIESIIKDIIKHAKEKGLL